MKTDFSARTVLPVTARAAECRSCQKPREDSVVKVPIGLPEISHNNMFGFLDSEYKLRRLDEDTDIAYLYDEAFKLCGHTKVSHSVIAQETKKLKEKYKSHIQNRKNPTSEEEVEEIDYDDEVWEDGYHEVKGGDGKVLKKGQFIKGKLVDGIEYNIILRVAKGKKDVEEPIPYGELREEKWHFNEYGQYDGVFSMMIAHDDIVEEGLQFFYVVDKRVKTEGKLVKPTFTNFRALESFLAQEEPDELDYIKTGVRKYDQTDYADIEI